MKKFLLIIALIFSSICFGLTGCGSPYDNMKIAVSQNEIVLYMNPAEEGQSNSASFTVTVSGVDTSVISPKVDVKYLTSQTTVSHSISYNTDTQQSTITLNALSKGTTRLVVVSQDNDEVKSEEIVVQVVTIVESFTVKSDATVSLATGSSLDLNQLSIFNFSPDTDQTEMNFTLLSEDDERFDSNYSVFDGVSINNEGIMTADADSIGGIVQVLATSKYIPVSANEQQIEKLSKVFKVMIYRNFDSSNIKAYSINDLTTPINNILFTINDIQLNPQTIVVSVENDTATNFVYQVVSKKDDKNEPSIVSVKDGTLLGVKTFELTAEESGSAVLVLKAQVVDAVTNKVYVEKETEFNVSCVRVVNDVTLSSPEVESATNGETLEIEIFENSAYQKPILGTEVDVSIEPLQVENKNYVLRLVSVDGVDATTQERDDIIIKVSSAGNTEGVQVAFGEQISDGKIFISYINQGFITSNFILAVVANSHDTRLQEVVTYIKCNTMVAVGDITIGDYEPKMCIGDEISFSFSANGASDRFNYSFSTPNIVSFVLLNDEQRIFTVKALKAGETTLTISAKGTGNSATASFKVIIPLESVSLSVPTNEDVPKITQQIYGNESVIDDQGLIDLKPLTEVAVKSGAIFKLNSNISPSGATVDSISYESSSPSTASIDNTGRIVAFSTAGDVTITVTYVYQVKELGIDGLYRWAEKTSIRQFVLTVYRPITSVNWLGGSTRTYVEVWDYNSLSPTDQALGRASSNVRAVVSPSNATYKTFEWALAYEEDSIYVDIENNGNSVTVTGHLPRDFDGDEYEVNIIGWILEYGVQHSITCTVKIKKPQHLKNIGVLNYNDTDGVYLESSGSQNVSNAYWELFVSTSPFEALSHEISFVIFDAELKDGEIVIGDILPESEQIVSIQVVDGITRIVPVVGKMGYTVVRIIPSSLLNQIKPSDSELTNEENEWVIAATDPEVYYDLWVMVANGSAEAPYQILDVKDFCDIEVKGLDKHYQIKRDLDFSSIENWTPLGGIEGFSGSITSFKFGETQTTFKLTGLKIDTSKYNGSIWSDVRSEGGVEANAVNSLNYFGLFTKNSGSISNIEIVYSQIVIDMSSVPSVSATKQIETIYAGAVVGYNTGSITDVNVSITDKFFVLGRGSNIDSQVNFIGGITGYNEGSLVRTTATSINFDCTINNDVLLLGGLIGYNLGEVNGSILTYDSELDVSTGEMVEIEIILKTSLTLNAVINGTPDKNSSIATGIGGLIGVSGEEDNSKKAEVQYYDVAGNIIAENFNNVAGLIGSTYGGIFNTENGGSYVYNCSSNVKVYGASNVGGITGYNQGGSFKQVKYEAYEVLVAENDYSNTSIRGLTNVGGFIGQSTMGGKIEYCYVASYVPLNFVGENGQTMKSSEYRGDIVVNNANADSVVGGFIGYLTQTAIMYSYSNVSISLQQGSAGGFIGVSQYNGEYINDCYAITDIICMSSVETYLGEFIGKVSASMPSSFIQRCYAVTGLFGSEDESVGILYNKVETIDSETGYEIVEYNNIYNFANYPQGDAASNIEFENCYYVSNITGNKSMGATSYKLNEMQGYILTDELGTHYINGSTGVYGIGDEAYEWDFGLSNCVWVDYSARTDLNAGLPLLFDADQSTIMASVEVTNITASHAPNLYNNEKDILPVFFKFDEGKVVATLNNMRADYTYLLSDIMKIATEPKAGLYSAKFYITSSDTSVVSVVNPGVATTYGSARLTFNKTGTVTITVMSAQDVRNVYITFQICVIAGFSSFEMHKSDWVSGDDDHLLFIQVNGADVLVPHLDKNVNFSDELYIFYKIDDNELSVNPDISVNEFAQFVNYMWEFDGSYYVRIPISNETMHLLEGLLGTTDLQDLFLSISSILEMDLVFFDENNELTDKRILRFDNATTELLFGKAFELSTDWEIRIYKGVSDANIYPTSASIETSENQPVTLTIYTDATDVLLDNINDYVSVKLEIDDVIVTNNIKNEVQVSNSPYLTSGLGELTGADITSLVDEITLTKNKFIEFFGQYVFAEFNINLYEKYITSPVLLKYTFVIYNDLEEEVKKLEILVEILSTKISSIEVLHYLEPTDVAAGKADSEEISSGKTGLLVVNIYNTYADFDYLTVSSSYNENDLITFVQVEKDGANFVPLVPSSDYIDDNTIKGVKTSSFDGSFYFLTTLASGVKKGTEYVLTIKAWKDGSVVAERTEVKVLTARYVPYVNLSLKSNYDDNLVARGTAVSIQMNGSVTNTTIEISVAASNTTGKKAIVLDLGENYVNGYHFVPTSASEQENGKSISQEFILYVGPEAECSENGLEITATVTSVTSTGGTETTVNVLKLYIVDFIVDSLGVTGVSNGLLNPSMENAQALEMYFNIQSSTNETYKKYVGTSVDESLKAFADADWNSVGLSQLSRSIVPGQFYSGTKLADEMGYTFIYSGVDLGKFNQFCSTVLYSNCGLTSPAYGEDAVPSYDRLITSTADKIIFKAGYFNQASGNEYYVTYILYQTENNEYNQAGFTEFTVKVVEEEEENTGNIASSFSNIRNAVRTQLQSVNTLGDGYGGVWYYLDGSIYRAISSVNNTCNNFNVSYNESSGYALVGKTLLSTTLQAGLKVYYTFENNVYKFNFINATDDESSIVGGIGLREISTQFNVVFKNTSTVNKPTPIYDEAGLKNVVQGGNYYLMSDITLTNWTPLNVAISTLDGNGHIIYLNGINVSTTTSSGASTSELNLGLFTTISSGTVIKNLIVDVSKTIYINAQNVPQVNFGYIAGKNEGGSITNCDIVTTLNNEWYDETTTGDNSRKWLYYASLNAQEINSTAEKQFLELKSLIRNSNSSIKPTIASTFISTSRTVGGADVLVYTGGIVGMNDGGYITNSRVGRVSGQEVLGVSAGVTSTQGINIFSAGNLGGIAGYNSGVISSSYFANGYLVNTTTSGVESSSDATVYNSTGGLVAINDTNGRITTSYVEGMQNSITTDSGGKVTLGVIYSHGTVGGFVNVNRGSIENSYSNIIIKTQRAAGGFVYNNSTEKSVIKYSYSMSDVENFSSNVGPFTGIDDEEQVLNSGLIENCYYLINSNYVVHNDEPALGLSDKVENDEETSEWNDPNGTYFAGFVFTTNPDDEAAKMATWVMPSTSSLKKGPQLVDANNIATSYRDLNYVYQVGYSIGSSTNPYLIASVSDFNNLFSGTVFGQTTDNHVRIIADLDFNGVAPSTSDKLTMSGIIHGNGMSFKNYSRSLGSDDSTTLTSLGLFKSISGGIVSNLILEIQSEFSSSTATYVGGLAGQIGDSLIENITIKSYNNSNAKVTGRNVAGGLAGLIYGDSQIENVSSSVSVYVDYSTSQSAYGYGYRYHYLETQVVNNNASYVKSYNYSYAGGVAGIITRVDPSADATIVNCSTSGEVTIYADIVGGVFGIIDTYVIVSRIQFVVTDENQYQQQLWGNNFVGGLVGENRGKITQSFIAKATQSQLTDDQNLHIDLDATKYVGYTNLFKGESNAIGGLVGLNRGSTVVVNENGTIYSLKYGVIETSYSRVAVINDEAQVAGGIIGLAVDNSRLEKPSEIIASQAMSSDKINVRNLFNITNIYNLTGSDVDTEDGNVYFEKDESGNDIVKISGYIDECWSTGAVYAGGTATSVSGKLMFSDKAAGGFVGAMTDPFGTQSDKASLTLLNNQLSSLETKLAGGYNYGTIAGAVLYKTYRGTSYDKETSVETRSTLFLKDVQSGLYPSAESCAVVVDTVITNPLITISMVGKENEKGYETVIGNSTTIKDVVYDPAVYQMAFSNLTSNVWNLDTELSSNIFPTIALGKIVSQVKISTVEEFLEYMVGGLGGKYLLISDITIKGSDWGDRKALTEKTAISGQLRGYVGDGNAATITFTGFSAEQLATFESVFGIVSAFSISNINFVFPENITSYENNVSSYFGLIACEARNYSTFENIKISINGDNKEISVNEKTSVSAFVGYSDNCTYSNLSIIGGLTIKNTNYIVRSDGASTQTSFGGVVGLANGKTNMEISDFGSIKFNIVTVSNYSVAPSLYFGGLIGSNQGTLNLMYSVVNVDFDISTTQSSNVYIGGLVGASSNSGAGEITNCNVTMKLVILKTTVQGNLYIGGIIGDDNYVTLRYNNVLGENEWKIFASDSTVYVGGLAGKVTMDIIYGTSTLNANARIMWNVVDTKISVGSSVNNLIACDVFAGGLIGLTKTVVSGSGNNIPQTSIIVGNTVLGNLNVYGGFTKGQSKLVQAFVGGVVGDVQNFASSTTQDCSANTNITISESISMCNVEVYGFMYSMLGGIAGRSYCVIQNCASYGLLSYTASSSDEDNLDMGGLVGQAYCPVSSCLTTSVISQYGLDTSRDVVSVSAIIGRNKAKGTLMTACYYNFELSGVLETNSGAERIEDIDDMFLINSFTFSGAEWTTRQVGNVYSFAYPTSLGAYLNFEVGGNMVPVYASSLSELKQYFENSDLPNKIIIIDAEHFDADFSTDMNMIVQNCSRLVGNGVIIEYSEQNLTSVAELGDSIGAFAEIGDNIVVSGINVILPKLSVVVTENTVNTQNETMNIGMFAGINKGILINCQAGYLPSVSTNISQKISELASLENLTSSDYDVSTLNVTMNGGLTDKSIIYVGGLVGNNMGSINMCWSFVDLNIKNTTTTSDETIFETVTFKLYIGGLVGHQENIGSTTNCYTMGRLNLTNAFGPTNSELGTYIGGVIGYDHSDCVSNLLGVMNFSVSDDVAYVQIARVGTVLGGRSSNALLTLRKLYGCADISLMPAALFNTATLTSSVNFNALKNLTFDNNWSVDMNKNYGVPYLSIYKGDLSTGSGTEENPYQIVEGRGLMNISQNTTILSRYYVLTRDVTITGVVSSSTSNAFYNLDGAGHKVLVESILSLQMGTRYGLFASLSNTKGGDAIIKNLIVQYANYTSERITQQILFGGIVIKNSGTISNCAVVGTTYNKNASLTFSTNNTSSIYGGIANENSGTIQQCFTSLNWTNITGTFGGIVGKLTEQGTINECFATGNVTGLQAGYYGGLVGQYTTSATVGILNSYAKVKYITVDLNSVSTFKVGALVGNATVAVTARNCYFYSNEAITTGAMSDNIIFGAQSVGLNHSFAGIYIYRQGGWVSNYPTNLLDGCYYLTGMSSSGNFPEWSSLSDIWGYGGNSPYLKNVTPNFYIQMAYVD